MKYIFLASGVYNSGNVGFSFDYHTTVNY